MKILFIARTNLYKLGGGDKIQILKTKQALERRGHEVHLATGWVNNWGDYDAVHLFNMMISPHSYFLFMLAAKRVGRPVALSTIYWNPGEWLAHIPAGENTKINSKLNQLRYPFVGITPWRVILCMLSFPEARRWLYLFLRFFGTGRASAYIRKSLIEGVDIILPNGKTEADAVASDFGRPQRSLVVPNGVDDEFGGSSGEAFRLKHALTNDFVLHVGRFESRKNLIALAAAVKRLGYPLVLIGNMSSDPSYTHLVKQAAPDDTIYIPELPHEELGSAYKAAKVHALASWFETPGLSSLEAGLAGCNVVTTDRGTTEEYFSDLAWYCDPADEKSIEQAVQTAYEAPKSHKLRDRILEKYTWDEAAAVTEEAYEAIVKPRNNE